MQHTLLPTRERKALRREYRTRLTIVLCFMLSTAGLIGVGALFPGFVRATIEERAALSEVDALKKDKDKSGAGTIESELKSDAALLSALGAAPAPRLSKIAESVVSSRSGLKLTSLSLSRAGTSTITVVIQGTAPTRSGLLSFKDRLADLAPGNKIDLPISELTKSSNIPFSLSMTETLK